MSNSITNPYIAARQLRERTRRLIRTGVTTQRDLARRSGVPQSTISTWLRDLYEPRLEKLAAIHVAVQQLEAEEELAR